MEEFNDDAPQRKKPVRGSQSPTKGGGMMKVITILIILIIVIGGGYLAYQRYGKSTEAKQAAENLDNLTALKKLMIVPEEEPVFAVIKDATVLLKEQAFYSGAQNGDVLVIFPKNQKAVIYSPTRNLIVNSGPFIVNPATGVGQ